MKSRTHTFFVTALLALPFYGAAQYADKEIEKKMDSLFSEYNAATPGVAVAVVQNGKINFAKGYGMANLEYQIPITTETVFHIASVSKQFTAFSIYLLVQQGKISLEDDIRKYIPELPVYNSPIKIKYLLAHTSGLRDQWAILTLAGWQMEDIITTEQILHLITNQKNLNFNPGTAVAYSNTGYTLLAEVVKRVSGQTFAEFTRANIFQPLGMINTRFYDDFHKVLNKNRAYSYERVNNEWRKSELHYSTVGATSLMTTVEDLAKWSNNFDSLWVGNAQLLSEFNKPSLLNNGEPVIWGTPSQDDTTYHAKGQLIYTYKGLKVMSHGGHDAGFRAVLTRFPENNLTIITLSNNEHYTMIRKVLPIADLYLSGQFKELTPVNNAPNQSNNQAKTEIVNNRLTDFEGSYHSEELITGYRIIVKNGTLIMTHPRLSEILLSSTGKDSFSGTNSFAFELKFLRKGQKVVAFEISNFGAKNIRFNKLK